MSLQHKFLIKEFWILSWNASVQRALKYQKSTSENDRQEFRKAVIDYCDESIIPCYKSSVSESAHIENILKVRDHAIQCAGDSILEKQYNVGIAQKLLNLQLKYMWCAGYIEKPPHCPVDRVILGETRLKGLMNWTQITSVDDYVLSIKAINEAAGSKDIADWELDVFNRRNSRH